MPSFIQKTSFYDPESGRQFVAADDGFYWKEAKKSPEESKVTRLMNSHGWQLRNGNDVWLIYKRPQQPGELFVIRGEKKWYFDMPNEPFGTDVPEGQGLDSLQQALTDGTFNAKPKAKAQHASATSTAVNNAGSPRQIMHDDSGAQTGLRMRPDYGESDSYTVQMNEANSKGASIIVLDGGAKFGSVTKSAKMFVTGATYDGMALEKFTFSPDPRKACTFARLTAQNLSRQLKGKFGVIANVLPVKA
jgi:hypothetical protein